MPGKINSLTEEEQARYLDNSYNIQEINFEENIQHHCPLGEQVGVTTYTVLVKPGKHLAELIQLHWDIQKMMGQTFTLESGASEVLEIVKKAYVDPKYVSVKAKCPPNRHMSVEVMVEYGPTTRGEENA